MTDYSRLARRNERLTRRQSTLLFIASGVILILFIFYGFPAVLNFSGTLGSRFGRKIAQTNNYGLAPTAPRFSQEFEATKSASITLHGVADPKVSVEVFQNERSLGTTLVKDDGTFSVDADLSKGSNVFTVVAISESGQKSAVSDPYIISYLSAPPKLGISSPKDGDNIKDTSVMIQGTTDPGVQITVNDRLAIVGSDGKFSYPFNLSSGDNKIKITATDKAGNQTAKEITVKQG